MPATKTIWFLHAVLRHVRTRISTVHWNHPRSLKASRSSTGLENKTWRRELKIALKTCKRCHSRAKLDTFFARNKISGGKATCDLDWRFGVPKIQGEPKKMGGRWPKGSTAIWTNLFWVAIVRVQGGPFLFHNEPPNCHSSAARSSPENRSVSTTSNKSTDRSLERSPSPHEIRSLPGGRRLFMWHGTRQASSKKIWDWCTDTILRPRIVCETPLKQCMMCSGNIYATNRRLCTQCNSCNESFIS